MNKNIISRLLLILIFFMIIGINAFAQDQQVENYPNKNITLVVPFGPGGGTDLMARALSAYAGNYLPVNLQVVTMPGGGTVEGTKYFLDLEKDGHVLIMGGSFAIQGASLLRNPGYTPLDFRGIISTGQVPYVFLVKADSEWESFEDFLKYAQENEGLAYGAPGVGSGDHFAGMVLERALNLKFNFTPQEGSYEKILAVARGELDFDINSIATGLSGIESGLVKPLAVFSPDRLESLPDVPTLKELGHEVVFQDVRAVYTHKDVPEERVRWLEEVFTKIVKDESYISMVTKMGEPPYYLSSDELTEYFNNLYDVLYPIAEEMLDLD